MKIEWKKHGKNGNGKIYKIENYIFFIKYLKY